MTIGIEGDVALNALGRKLGISPDDLYTGLRMYITQHGVDGRAKFIEDLEKRLAAGAKGSKI
ncbi:hypothetical protein ES705_09411 [subsurface metagenome]